MSSKPQKKSRGKEVGKIEEDVKKAGGKVKRAAAKVEKEVKKGVKEVTEKRVKKVQQKPSGRVPQAMVVARHEMEMITRPGRGFSLGELSGASLSPRLATVWGVRVDYRRRSVLEGNVGSLKSWHRHPGTMAKVEKEPMKLVRAIEEAGEEVEKEAAAIEKEAVVVGKKVKKEAKKAAESVKEEVEKPKSRPKKKKKEKA